jgi:cytochrome bd ubiquinol oxidase subunit I
VVHGTLGAYVFTGFTTAGICALAWLRGDRRPRVWAGLRIAMTVAAIAIPLQIVMGDIIVRFDADHEPAKFAALEVVRHTQRGAPLTLGGFPTPDGDIAGAVEIPRLLSVLVAFDPNAEVRGLDRIAPNDRPPIAATHLSFDAMVGSGFALLALAIAWAIVAMGKRAPPSLLLAATAAGGLLAVVALEAGWFVTEFGRQPWIAVGLQRTAAAVTPAPHLELAFAAFSGIYVVLAAMCWWLLRRIGRAA